MQAEQKTTAPEPPEILVKLPSSSVPMQTSGAYQAPAPPAQPPTRADAKKHARGRPLNPSDRRPPPPPQSSPSRSVWLRVHWLARRAPRQFLDSCSHGPSAQIVKASFWGTSLQTPWCGMAGFLTLRKRSTAARHRWRPQSRTQGRSRARTQTADPWDARTTAPCNPRQPRD